MKQEYFLEEIQQNESMSKKYKKFFTTLNYIEHILILTFTITGYIQHPAFASLYDVPIGITSSKIGLKVCNCCRNYLV